MGKMSSFGNAVSGLNAARAGLYVVGHNISNVNTTGYTRQQITQNDFMYQNIGNNAHGFLQVGLGTDVSEIRQIRNKYLDMNYRDEAGQAGFYSAKYTAGLRIEEIIGELTGEYRFQDVIKSMYDSLSELSKDPDGLDARQVFISSAIVFVDKANNVGTRLIAEQDNLNDKVIKSTQRLNTLLTEINEMNLLIAGSEASGDNANDFRDRRNNAIDELSLMIPIDIKEQPNKTVTISTNGNELVAHGMAKKIGLRYTSATCNFVEPVFTNSKETLKYDPTDVNATPLFNMSTSGQYLREINATNQNDKGSLAGLLIARGTEPANYSQTPEYLKDEIAKQDAIITGGGLPAAIAQAKIDKAALQKKYFNVTQCTIPKSQMRFDTLVNGIVTMINDVVAPKDKSTSATAPHGIDDARSQFIPIFLRGSVEKNMPRYYETAAQLPVPNPTSLVVGDLIEEDPTNISTLYTMGNIILNPDIVGAKNYDKIPLSYSEDIGDNTILKEMLINWNEGWKSGLVMNGTETKGINQFYFGFIDGIAIELNEASGYMKAQTDTLILIDNKRKQVSGVSMDEEMKNMLVYQHAYNASSRVITTVDSMMETIIGLKR